jgi:hypothetical protein
MRLFKSSVIAGCLVITLTGTSLLAQAAGPPTKPNTPNASGGEQNKPAAKGVRDLPTVRFTHRGCGPAGSECRAAYALDLDDADEFQVYIDSTRLADFVYNIAGVLAAKPSEEGPQTDEWDDTAFVQRHDKKYGGYLVTIRKKPGSSSPLPEATLVVSVRTKEWILGFAGGFPISTIVDRVYSLRDSTVGETKQYYVQQDLRSRDHISLATATFIHARKNTWPFAYSFGLGIGGNTAYYLGPSVMLGEHGAFTAGFAFGARKDLPAGVQVNALTTNANALANLTPRNVLGAFIGFSYTFLGGDKSPFEKPFKGGDSQQPAPAAQQPPAAPPASSITLDLYEGARNASVALTLVIAQAAGKPDFTDNVFRISMEGPLSGIPESVTLDLANKRTAQKTFQVKVKNDAPIGAQAVKLKVDGQGVDATLESKPFTVKNP